MRRVTVSLRERPADYLYCVRPEGMSERGFAGELEASAEGQRCG